MITQVLEKRESLCDTYPFSSSKMSCANTQVKLTACPLCPIPVLTTIEVSFT